MARTYLETTTARYLLDQGRLLPMDGWAAGFAQVFTTHDQNWSFGVVDIQGPVKFAEPLVRRTLRERRELTEGDRLWLYRVVAQGDRFQAVYGIISGERYDALSRASREQGDGLALFDAVSVVLGLLKNCRAGKTRAVMVLTLGAAVVGIGDRRHCHWLVRMVMDEGRLEPVWDRIRAEAAWRKLTIQGIDLIRVLDEDVQAILPRDVRQWPVKGYAHATTQAFSSLETLLPRLPLNFGPITREERLHRPLERAEPLAWAALAAMGLVFFGFGYWWQERVAELTTRTAALRDQIVVTSSPDPATHVVWDELNRLRDAVGPALERPLAGEALARLTAATSGLGRISEIVVTEEPLALELRIKGGLPDRGRDAGAVFQRILLGLSGQGFEVQERLLELGSAETTFTVMMTLDRHRHSDTAAWSAPGGTP
jgi:hypothetical protein